MFFCGYSALCKFQQNKTRKSKQRHFSQIWQEKTGLSQMHVLHEPLVSSQVKREQEVFTDALDMHERRDGLLGLRFRFESCSPNLQ